MRLYAMHLGESCRVVKEVVTLMSTIPYQPKPPDALAAIFLDSVVFFVDPFHSFPRENSVERPRCERETVPVDVVPASLVIASRRQNQRHRDLLP